MILLLLIAALLAAEVVLFLTVQLQRRGFPWLITKRDDLPAFDIPALEKFLDHGFDPHLGWVKKPNTSGVEKGRDGPIKFHIDSMGSRASPQKAPALVAAFGDSYAFCRQVGDDETWQAQFALQAGFGVLNFGVGNYGVDQALLRYEATVLPDSVRFVVMNVVPETICRIQSYWKHYLEFGNTFAFKPRFEIALDGDLALLDNIVRSKADFLSLKKKLPKIREIDGFYERKFRSFQFRFPYLLSWGRHPIRQSLLMGAVAFRGFFRLIGRSSSTLEDLPFTLLMKGNLRDAYGLYRDQAATDLLAAVMLRFKAAANRRQHVPLVVVTPQLLDLALNRRRVAPYCRFLRELSLQVAVLDLTEKFAAKQFERLYVNDRYGGHLSVEGNRLVATEIGAWVDSQRASLEATAARRDSTTAS